MPNYQFRVGTSDGQIIEREFRAIDLEAAKQEATRQGLHIFDARRSGFAISQLLPKRRKAISTERFLLFNQELIALVRAGLPIVQSFEIMLERQKAPRFREILTEIRDQVKSGVAISDAFAGYGNMFPPIYSTSLRAGERSGDLEGVLKRFLRYQKLIVALKKRVVGALIYPTVLVGVSLAMIFVMLTFVIPKFTTFYEGFGAELPPFTRFLIALSFSVRDHVVVVVAGLAMLIFLVNRWTRTRTGGAAWDHFLLMIPAVGGVLHRFAILQFTQSLGTLLGGGTPMVPALEIASQSITNRYVAKRMSGLVNLVREGEPLWRSLDSTGVISDLAIEMIKVGESTGALVEMLSNVSEFYDEEIEATLSRMVALIEPLILVSLGCIIAALLYAFYLPLFQLANLQNG